MKTTFAVLARIFRTRARHLISSVVLLLSLNALGAGTDAIIKQHAKEIRDQNNVRQGVAPPTQPSTAPSGPTAPTLSPALTRFQTVLAGIKTESPATAEQKQKLAQELVAAGQTAKPSFIAATKLVDKITAAFAEKPLSATSRARLVQELDAVINPAKYPMAKLEGIFADIQAVFQENGLSRNKAIAIVDDVKAISAEIQKGGAK